MASPQRYLNSYTNARGGDPKFLKVLDDIYCMSAGCDSFKNHEWLVNGMGKPMGIAPASPTWQMQYQYQQPLMFTRKKEPKNIKIGQELRELWLISMNFTKSAWTLSILGHWETHYMTNFQKWSKNKSSRLKFENKMMEMELAAVCVITFYLEPM